MSGGATWRCPGCGAVRSLEVVREVLAGTRGVLACWQVPTGYVPARAARVAAAAARLARRGEAVLPAHLAAAGCGLVWCTVVDGRTVWAAEAEELAVLLAGGEV